MKSIFGSKTRTVSVFAVFLLASFAPGVLAQTNCVSHPAGLVSWWQAESNALDSAGGNNGIFTGSAFGIGEVGGAFNFDGGGNNVRVPASAGLDLGVDSGLTIEAWIESNDNSYGRPIVEWVSKSVGGYAVHFFAHQGVPGTLYADLYDTANNHHVLQSPAGLILTNVFQHVAVTYDKASGIGRLLINGTAVEESQLGTFTPQTTSDLSIGYRPDTIPFGPIPFIGRIDEVSLYSRALSPAELQGIYNAGAAGKCKSPVMSCAPAPAGLVGWWQAESNAVDSVGGNNGILTGTTFAAGEVGSAFNFDGGDSNIRVPASGSLDVGTNGGLTIEAWINSTDNTYGRPILEWVPQTVGDYGVHFFAHVGAPGTLYADLFDTENNHHILQSAAGLVLTNVFQHVAVTYDKASGIGRLLINGSVVGESVLGTFIPKTSPDLSIGFRPNTVPFGPIPFIGRIDELGLYSRALSVAELQGIYTAGSAGKCVSQVMNCTPAPAGLVSWWQAEGSTADSVSGNNGILHGGVSFAPGKSGNGFSFDGTGYIVIPDNPTLNFSTALTIELWYMSALPNSDYFTIIDKRVGASIANYGINNAPVSGLGVFYDDPTVNDGDDAPFGSFFEVSRYSPAPNPGAFHHLAASYQQLTNSHVQLQTYVDGQLVRTKVIMGNLSNTLNSSPVTIGAAAGGAGEFFKGIIDEVSIYNRAIGPSEIQAIYSAGAADKCGGLMSPVISTQPVSQTAQVGDEVTFAVVAGGSAPLSYQWQFNGTPILNETSSSLVLVNVSQTNAGIYSVVITNLAGSVTSSNAVLTVTLPPASIQVADATATVSGAVSLPINLLANGNENALGFTLNFDPAVLTYEEVVLGTGATGASLLLNHSQAAAGRVGVAVGMPAGITFVAGTRQLVLVRFTSAIVTASNSVAVTFGDAPIQRLLADVSGQPLAANYLPGTVFLPPTAFEGDVYPRPNGDETLSISDWVLVGRYVARLDSPTNSAEFQRADCAPRTTLGNGSLTVSDWVQAGRFAAGLDPISRVGGPDTESPTVMAMATESSIGRNTESNPRQLKIVAPSLTQGQSGAVDIELVAQGDENALAFSLSFDPAKLVFIGATAGEAAVGAVLNVNLSQSAQGHLGCVLALKASQSFAAGSKQVIKASFRSILSVGGSAAIAFSDRPVPRGISDPNASELAADYINGSLVINPRPSLRISTSVKSISLSWPSSAGGFVLQESGDPGLNASAWKAVEVPPVVTSGENVVSLPANAAQRFYRLYQQ